jgi:hypothetical protein
MMIGGVINIDKEDLNALSVLNLYDEAADMRIYATTAIDTGASDDVYDTIGPAWYSHGAADFMFEDCIGFVDADGDGLMPGDDPDCVDFLRYGYIDVETGSKCNDNIDNDGNGDVDCNDSGCMYNPYYCDFDDVSDNSAPRITWLEIEEFSDGAFVDIDTDEPTNATLLFHRNDSYCSNVSDAIPIVDWKLSNTFLDDDYDFWHDFFVDQIYFGENSINYTIEETSTYYFKVKLCDKSGNCAVSACTSFTTNNVTEDFVVGFDLPPPESDITTYLGKVVVLFDLDGDGSFGDVIDSTNGILVNDTAGRNVNIRFTNLNATDTWSIDFIGADLLKALTLDITDTFIVNDTAGGDALVGMDSDKWVELAQRLGVDYIRIQIPVGLPAETDGQLIHCPDDVIDLSDSRCVELDMSDINCTFNTDSTVCYIPTSVGFSIFGVTEDTGDDNDPDDPTSPTGGGGATETFWETTYTVADEDFEAGYTRNLGIAERLRFYIEGEQHHVGVVDLDSASVTVNVSSETQQRILFINQYELFELNGDNYYDLSILLNDVFNNTANLTILPSSERIPEPFVKPEVIEVVEETQDIVESIEEDVEEEEDYSDETIPEMIIRKLSTISVIWLVILLILVGFGLAFILNVKHHHPDKENREDNNVNK